VIKRFFPYLSTLARANGLDDRVKWFFYPGMLQDSPYKWWADFGRRPKTHEGIDICFFKEGKKMSCLAKDALVPAMGSGLILNRCEDFLGETLVVGHEKFDYFSSKLIFVYSHLKIQENLKPGSRIEKGQIIARIFDTSQKQSKLLPHLHFSCMEPMENIPFHDLNWNLFSNRRKVNLINPVYI
jgi:hypothetical protein